MKVLTKTFILLSFSLMTVQAWSQASSEAIKEKDLTLSERYQIMKEKSQTYQDYKVIKEFVLDGVWKIVKDSLKQKDNKVAQAKTEISNLKHDILSAKEEVKKTNESVAEVMHDSTHINFLGIDVNKTAFISFFLLLVLGLVVMLGLLFGRLKWLNLSVKEKTESLDIVNKEFDDFKHKALEKQMKLSRELQNERNKLQELRSHH